jgi:hypothetical protein
MGNIDDDTPNGILALARIWSASATGSLHSKDTAAAWALDRLPEEPRAVLARARVIYLGDEQDRWDNAREDVRRYVDYVVAEIERLTDEPDNVERPRPSASAPASSTGPTCPILPIG